jgi:three-Cys-motif partner protein
VLPTIQYEKYTRALCLLDPYGLELDWQVILQAGQSRAVDLMLNFPVMDMNRNAIWHAVEKVPQAGIERMSRFWGDESWREAAYGEARQHSLFGPPEIVKQGNDEMVAGFGHVADPLPMRNSKNAIVYYLFLASPKAVAEKIIRDIFRKYA